MEVVAGVLITVFLGFVANRFGYLSVHKPAPKPSNTVGGGRPGPDGSFNERENLD